MKLNYNVLKVGDIVCCTSLKPLAIGIRTREAGVLNAFHTNICTHVGIIVPVGYGDTYMLAIAEMLGDGLKINSLSDYMNKGYFGDRIVDIKRFEPFDDPDIMEAILKQIMIWWQEGKKYDYAGALKYVLPFLKDKVGQFYCSELLAWLALNITRKSLVEDRPKDDNIHPWAIQTSKLLTSVAGFQTK